MLGSSSTAPQAAFPPARPNGCAELRRRMSSNVDQIRYPAPATINSSAIDEFGKNFSRLVSPFPKDSGFQKYNEVRKGHRGKCDNVRVLKNTFRASFKSGAAAIRALCGFLRRFPRRRRFFPRTRPAANHFVTALEALFLIFSMSGTEVTWRKRPWIVKINKSGSISGLTHTAGRRGGWRTTAFATDDIHNDMTVGESDGAMNAARATCTFDDEFIDDKINRMTFCFRSFRSSRKAVFSMIAVASPMRAHFWVFAELSLFRARREPDENLTPGLMRTRTTISSRSCPQPGSYV